MQAAAISYRDRFDEVPGRTDAIEGNRPVWGSLLSNTSCKTGGTKPRRLSSWIVNYGNGLKREEGWLSWGTDRSKVDPRR